MISQFAKGVIAIRPINFAYNREAAEDNDFMIDPLNKKINQNSSPEQINQLINMKAKRKHFEYMMNINTCRINTMIFDQVNPIAYDSVWPDWFTTHKSDNIPEGVLIIYPMKTHSRRLEKDQNIINKLRSEYKYFIDLSYLENKNIFVEGKGSVIFDNANNKLFCSLSKRTNLIGVETLKNELDKISKIPWKVVTFTSHNAESKVIYHTDCVFQLLDKHAVICLESISEDFRKNLIDELCDINKNSKKIYEIIEINFKEMQSMCANILNVKNDQNENVILMSTKAFSNYSQQNLDILSKNYKILSSNISIFEKVGGGSARCLLAEHF